jgi:RNA-directed DNA polymerase
LDFRRRHSNLLRWVDRTLLMEILRKRIRDKSLLRLIGKCLKVGVLDGTQLSYDDTGVAQGSILSPLLGNIFLHYILDVWFEEVVKPRLRGSATIIRFCDDFVICIEQ